MQNEKPVYEWNITKRQRRIKDCLAGSSRNMGYAGLVMLTAILGIFILIISAKSGENLWAVFIGVVAAISGTWRIWGRRMSLAFRNGDDDIAENYKIFESGIEISGPDKTPLFLKWTDVKRVEMYSNTPWYCLQVFGGYASDAITIVNNNERDLYDLVVDRNPQKKDIFDYIKNEIALNPPPVKRNYKSFRMYER